MSPDDRSDDFWGTSAGGQPPREAAPGSGSGFEPEPPEREATDAGKPLEDFTGDKMSVIEALLFVSPEPLSMPALAELTGFEPGATRAILNELKDLYEQRGGGIALREVAGGFGFYATPEAAPFIARLIRGSVNPRLTRAALETLAIVAYLQPVSRGVVAEIRGVQSEGVIKTLEDRCLVEAVGRGGPPGYPALYGTTSRFLERFGLGGIEELPGLDEFAPDEETVEKIKSSLSWELLEEERFDGRAARKGPEDTGPDGCGLQEGGGDADTGGQGDGEREDGGPR